MKKTLADIIISARQAAETAHTLASTLEQQTAKLKAFADSGLDKLDFPNWEQEFNACVDLYQAFSKQPAPSTVAAAKMPAPTAS
jgi:hypothetical protein